MENTRTYIYEITNDILDNYFSSIDTLSELISPDPIRATRIIVNKIIRALHEFEEYCPLTGTERVHTDENGNYTFKDNYIDVVEQRESLENMELIPRTIARVGGNALGLFSNMSSTSNYWHYNAPTLRCYSKGNDNTIYALYHYPIYMRYTEMGTITKDSHIFGLDKFQRSMLYNLMELTFLRHIKGNSERVKLPTSVEFFNLDNDIQLLEKQVEDDKSACSAVSIAWN